MLLPVSGSGPEDAVFVLNDWIYPHPIRGGVSSGVRQPGAGFPFQAAFRPKRTVASSGYFLGETAFPVRQAVKLSQLEVQYEKDEITFHCAGPAGLLFARADGLRRERRGFRQPDFFRDRGFDVNFRGGCFCRGGRFRRIVGRHDAGGLFQLGGDAGGAPGRN